MIETSGSRRQECSRDGVEKRTRKFRGSRRYRSAMMESLETRTLLSASSIAVAGNGTFINNNDTTPSTADFTDFGPMTTTASALLGVQTRSFFIENLGDGPLSLTGGAKLVRISGIDAGDFTVLTKPATSVAVGTTSTFFVIEFVPHAAGVRTATVTIPSNDPVQPNFTFKIRGTGVVGQQLGSGLQIATLTAGSGTGAMVGSDLMVDYTGYEFNGFQFDTSLQAGRSPLEVNPLGFDQQDGLIHGWNVGLVGMKTNEERVLFIPSAMAYGNNTNSGLANTPLIFTVTANSVTFPDIQVKGNGTLITPSDSTPSVLDGTLLPTNTASTTTSTFELLNNSTAGALAARTGVSVFSFTGSGASAFSFTNVHGNSLNDYLFDIAFHPSKPGTYTATAHIKVNDPVHPDYSFTVRATATAFIDLMVTSKLAGSVPTNMISGNGSRYTLPVLVYNQGDIKVPGNAAPLQYQVYLHPTTGGGADILLPSTPLTSTNIRGEPVGAVKVTNVSFKVPISVPTGAYKLLLKINHNGAIPENNLVNDTFTSGVTINVTQGTYNLNGTIASSTVPTTIANSTPFGGKVAVTVASAGNLVLAANQQVIIQILAHNTGDSTDTIIGTGVFTIAKWLPGHKATFVVTTKALEGLEAGSYQLEAKLTPTPAMSESSTADNVVTKTAANAIVALTVT